MRSLELFKINLKGLKADKNDFCFFLDHTYFEAIDAPDIRCGQLEVVLEIKKMADSFECLFQTKGWVNVACDICLDDMQQAIDTENRIVVVFGEDNSENDDLVFVSEREGILDTSWLIYEFIMLSIPIKHVHAPGKCDPAMVEKLQSYGVARSTETDKTEHVDLRWAELNKLKTIIK